MACFWPYGIAFRVVMSSSRCPWLRTMRADACAACSRVPSNEYVAAARAAASRDDLAARVLSATRRQQSTPSAAGRRLRRHRWGCAPQQRGRRWPRDPQRHGAPSARQRGAQAIGVRPWPVQRAREAATIRAPPPRPAAGRPARTPMGSALPCGAVTGPGARAARRRGATLRCTVSGIRATGSRRPMTRPGSPCSYQERRGALALWHRPSGCLCA